MSDAAERAENLLSLTTRLSHAVEADIAALETGKYPPLALADPVIEQMSLVYGREVTAAHTAGIKDAPSSILRALKDAAAKLKDVLKHHERLVSAMRSASEGMVKAVADEVEKMRTAALPYTATPQAKRAAAGAIVYNRVV